MTQPAKPIELLTPDEVSRVLASFSRRHATGIRNRAMLAVFWRSGLRSAEARSLLMRDVDLAAGTIHVRHGKGGRARRVGIDAWGVSLLELWLSKRSAMPRVSPSQRFFCTHDGGEISGQYVRRAFAYAGEGLAKRVHPHVFRHMFAVELSQRGVPLPTISQAMGHADVSITAQYLRHLDPRAVIVATRGY